MHVNDLLKTAVASGASDLHIKVGSYPMMRLRGQLLPVSDEKRLDHEDVVAMSAAVMSKVHAEKFKDAQEVDLAYGVPGLGRFRVNVFQQRGTVGLVLRVIPTQIKSIDELGLPPVLRTLALEERGLILVTGTTGSGKSTTLAAMIDHINKQRRAHVMTVEDPIEFLHRDQQSIVNQREVAVDTRSFAFAFAARCVKIPTSSSSAKCAISRRLRRHCSPRRRAIWSSPPCTRSTRRKRSTASSRSSRRTSRNRSAFSSRAC